MKIDKLVSRGSRVSIDDAGSVSHMHCCSDTSVKASARSSIACFGPDSRSDAVQELRGRRAERAERLQPNRAKDDAPLQSRVFNFILGLCGSGFFPCVAGGEVPVWLGSCLNNCRVPSHGQSAFVGQDCSAVWAFAVDSGHSSWLEYWRTILLLMSLMNARVDIGVTRALSDSFLT